MINKAGEAAYEKSIKSPKPLDPAAAAEKLKDVKRILDQLGVVFFLGSGTCLGAFRENRFIPWDDEMDTASVIGLHGFTEEKIERVITAFTENGYYVHVGHSAHSVCHLGVVGDDQLCAQLPGHAGQIGFHRRTDGDYRMAQRQPAIQV